MGYNKTAVYSLSGRTKRFDIQNVFSITSLTLLYVSYYYSTRKRSDAVKFVGRRIEHEWVVNEEKGSTEWYPGTVLSLLSGKDGGLGKYIVHACHLSLKSSLLEKRDMVYERFLMLSFPAFILVLTV